MAFYVGGDFLWAGELRVNHIARWDGTSWSALPGPSGVGTDGRIQSLMVWDDGGGEALYVGGRFDTVGGLSIPGIAKWDGRAWSPVMPGEEMNGFADAMILWDDGNGEALYAGGAFSAIGGNSFNNVARWDGAAWSSLGPVGNPGIDRVAADFAIWNDGTGEVLVVGALRFIPLGPEANGGEAAGSMPVWDGVSWDSINGFPGSGPSGEVYAVEVFDDGTGPALYAGGDFENVAGGVFDTNNIARWDGTSWHRFESPSGNGANAEVYSMTVWDDGNGPALFATGSFSTLAGLTANGIARWRGQEWTPMDAGGLGGNLPRNSLSNVDSRQSRVVYAASLPGLEGLYAGGLFRMASGVPSANLARWQCTVPAAEIFSDGFETGDITAWAISSP